MDYNVLVDGLPISYRGYKVRTSYKVGILLSQIMSDTTVEDDIKIYTATNLLYIDKPDDIQVSLKGIQWFLSCGKSEIHEIDKPTEHTNEIIIDYDTDQLDILAAFRVYKIELTDKMHYWEFTSILPNLKDTTLAQKMQYRSVDLKDLKGESRKFYAEMKNKYKVRPLMSEEEWQEYQNKLREIHGDYYMKLKALNS